MAEVKQLSIEVLIRTRRQGASKKKEGNRSSIGLLRGVIKFIGELSKREKVMDAYGPLTCLASVHFKHQIFL
jgi:hypothetical protein